MFSVFEWILIFFGILNWFKFTQPSTPEPASRFFTRVCQQLRETVLIEIDSSGRVQPFVSIVEEGSKPYFSPHVGCAECMQWWDVYGEQPHRVEETEDQDTDEGVEEESEIEDSDFDDQITFVKPTTPAPLSPETENFIEDKMKFHFQATDIINEYLGKGTDMGIVSNLIRISQTYGVQLKQVSSGKSSMKEIEGILKSLQKEFEQEIEGLNGEISEAEENNESDIDESFEFVENLELDSDFE
ncbi:SKN-1 Dependent Zygotic transcript [Caenorhabditis elegans]|uniref:SKN-1 Dependent Zygotic transcript n=1 Tax=Caenorhabditis elegans TaxID=6239 RepID=O62161_CAEEL|nr:SKN-1 Dependent Zygotic transcript [Caenorhabditis elegans]CAB04105.1 SKN-1 Dependent Zygotic transcript [Caenorhabditis elegans]|eukprot:NP_493084.1 SKN-1 Dependent Zygotic transcript [Caenorhabditis elegans]